MPAQAAFLAIPNSSFEAPDVADGANNKSVPPNNNVANWTNSQSGTASANNHIGVWDPSGAGPAGITGEQHVRIYMTEQVAWLKHTGPVLSATTVAGATYTLSADFMNGSGGGWNVNGQLQLWIGGRIVDSTALTNGNVPSTGYSTVTLGGYTAAASGQSIYAQVVINGGADTPRKVDIDNVQLDEQVPVPEPAGLGLLGVALLAMRKCR